jgi:hypothetical protein
LLPAQAGDGGAMVLPGFWGNGRTRTVQINVLEMTYGGTQNI